MNNRWSTRSFRRRMGQALTLCALASTSIASFAADDYPSRPVTIIVPFAAGGSADVYARIVAQQLSAQLKQSFIVDDRPGAGAIIGTEYVAQSKPDGYTLLLISNTHTVNETLYTNKPFKLMSDFVPVAPINSSDLVLVTRPGLGVNSVADLIKLARSEPGKLSYASSGYGTPYHMAGELFKQMAGVSILHVPYKGSSNARTDVIGGQVDMMFDATTTMAGFISSGKAKALATTGTVRSDLLPNLPTVDQSGVPKYNAVIWLGLVAPKGTPPAAVDKLNAALTRIVATPQIKASWQKQGADTMSMNPAQFTQFMNDDIKKWAQVVKVSGAKVDQ
ncbi:tripartite tricarboxylate transporter substrate binding protein [Paraburkholderia fungorum]|uniref:tripartite tricarboxylate transporter substrate binding protein n=1 Tax=Paraburkholderia fungorum TaxID=134537 RepID=UPI0038B6BA7C